ncbi:MAG: hypothetical protein WCT47_06630 [Betaproteobacteria bacterium]
MRLRRAGRGVFSVLDETYKLYKQFADPYVSGVFVKQAPAATVAPSGKPAASPREPVQEKGRVSPATRPVVKASARKSIPTGARKVPAEIAKPSAAAAAAPTPAAAAPEKTAKTPKPRLVRDSFTMPEDDFALVAALKARALKQGRAAKKSELLRAGLQLLSQQTPQALVAVLERLQPIKTGRPKRAD